MNITELAKIAHDMGYYVISRDAIGEANKDFQNAGKENEAHQVKDFLIQGLRKLSDGIVFVDTANDTKGVEDV